MDAEQNTLIGIEMVLSAVICLGFGFWQLWSLRREKRRDAEKAARKTDNA